MLDTTFFKRIDLTNERIYTLTDSTKSLLHRLDDVVFVKVYLHGDFPADFKRLEKSTQEMLDEFRVYTGDKLQYEFIDPLADKSPEEKQQIIKQLKDDGLTPIALEVSAENFSQSIIFPGAMLTYKGHDVPVTLIENQSSGDPQENLNNAVALLEHKFAFAIKQLTQIRKPKIGITYTHGELAGYNLYDLRNSLKPLYSVDSLDISRVIFLKKHYDAIIIPGPSIPFNDTVKFLLDQYIMNGGKVLLLTGGTNADMDSLRQGGSFIAQQKNLNLDDQLFTYGIRINPYLIADLECNRIPIEWEGQIHVAMWPFFPLVTPVGNNPIVKNLDEIAFQFASPIDTVEKNGIKKTILLQSSQYTKVLYTPYTIDYSIVFHQPDKNEYNSGRQTVAIKLEGEFQSLYKNRLAGSVKVAFDSLKIPLLCKSKPTKIIVISDGNVVKNGYDVHGIYPMGYYRYQDKSDVTVFDNKDFIMNCIEALTDNSGLIESRDKEIKLRLLDPARIKDEKSMWEIINMVVPIVAIILFGLIFNLVRNRRYAA